MKCSKEINIRTILKKSPEVALHLIEEAKMVLELWHSTYMAVREIIETSGTDHRWEFDRKRLFEQTNYMAKICENLQEVATVLNQFHKFLGPELKAVTGDSQGIDQVMGRVQSLVGPLESVPFDIFDRRYSSSWDAVMVQFRERVVGIELITRNFIDTSFQKLRSVMGAFDLLQNFQNIQSRESINKQMMEKYKDILMQYSKELEKLSDLFEKHKDCPPLYRNNPPLLVQLHGLDHCIIELKNQFYVFVNRVICSKVQKVKQLRKNISSLHVQLMCILRDCIVIGWKKYL